MLRSLPWDGMAFVLMAVLLAGTGWARQADAPAQNGSAPVAIVTDTVPQSVVHVPYHFQLAAQGGTAPYTWSIEKGKLPGGLQLQADTGFIYGTPTTSSKLTLTVRVTDSAEPPHTASREITVTSVPALQLEWQRHPVLENDGIYGQVKVGNPSEDPYDLTFIIVAVNEIGKAFALGYQHFTLRPQATQEIPFGSSLPLGTYIVHADAVGEIATKDIIRRSQLQTPKPLVRQ